MPSRTTRRFSVLLPLFSTLGFIFVLTGCSNEKRDWLEADKQFEQASARHETVVHQLGDWKVSMYAASVNHSIVYVFEAALTGHSTANNVVALVGDQTFNEPVMGPNTAFRSGFKPKSDDTSTHWTFTLSWDEGKQHFKKQFTFSR
jgi:hypothetical protein